jgi:hypothetical protein
MPKEENIKEIFRQRNVMKMCICVCVHDTSVLMTYVHGGIGLPVLCIRDRNV